MRVLVTGVAGFIGSSIADALIAQGHDVLGVDCFVDYYPREMKMANLAALFESPRFRFIEADISAVDPVQIQDWLKDYPYVSHQAAQAGVRSSWGKQFEDYVRFNVLGTQKLLEAARHVGVKRFVYASSSSVYGAVEQFPLREDGPVLPVSPYGVTKLAGEQLARLYYLNYRVPTISLRYFTVYGPRQRPEMAFHRLIRSALTGEAFPLYGDGSQSRSFTYVDDVVQANLAALLLDAENGAAPWLGEPVNIGGGARATLTEVIAVVEELTGKRINLKRMESQKGDVDRTEADLTRARVWLGYQPKTSLREGLSAQIEWFKGLLQAEGAPS